MATFLTLMGVIFCCLLAMIVIGWVISGICEYIMQLAIARMRRRVAELLDENRKLCTEVHDLKARASVHDSLSPL
jgi:uncharacterized membrane protein YciS (DUF1049 family)